MKLHHWKTFTNPKYMGAFCFQPGETITGTIANVLSTDIVGQDGKHEECRVCTFEEDLLPLILNKTNCKTIERIYGTGYIEEWAGKRITMCVQRVLSFGEPVDAVRIVPRIPPDPTINCDNCGAKLKRYQKLSITELAAYTKKKYGKCLCGKCATQAAQGVENEQKAEEPVQVGEAGT